MQKISLDKLRHNQLVLNTVEFDRVAAEIYGEFERFYIENNHAEQLANIIITAVKEGKKSIRMNSDSLDEVFSKDLYKELPKFPKNIREFWHLSEVAYKVSEGDYNGYHWSYGRFLIFKVIESIAEKFEVRLKYQKDRYGTDLEIIWDKEELKEQKASKFSFLIPFNYYNKKDPEFELTAGLSWVAFLIAAVIAIGCFILGPVSIAAWVSVGLFVWGWLPNIVKKLKPKNMKQYLSSEGLEWIYIL